MDLEPLIGERIPWLPDETLFSWCSRYHVLSANGLSSVTCHQLFGGRRQGVSHDLPSGIDRLTQRTGGSLGTTPEIIRDHTVLPFYSAFKPMHLYAQATAAMSGEGIGHLKYQLGLLTSGLGAAHPLKACPSCMAQDRRQQGVAHWRRTHQLPAAWFCPAHGDALLVSPLKLDQRARFQWALPDAAGLEPWTSHKHTDAPDESTRIGRRLASFAKQVCALPPAALADENALSRALRNGMIRRNWASPSGRVAWQGCSASLERHAAALSALPPMSMQVDGTIARAQLSRILSARSLTHPLRYLAWIGMLFDEFEDFLSAYQAAPAQPLFRKANLPSRPDEPVDPRAVDAVDAMLLGQESMSAIAFRVGVTHSTVAAWAAKAGLVPARRPKILDAPSWTTAVRMLSSGHSKLGIARHIGVSEVTVTRVLRTVPGLQEKWHAARHQAAQDQARGAWLAVMPAARLLGISAARRAEPAAYAWLYRNDRAWLSQQGASVAGALPAGNHRTIRTARADQRYARALATSLGTIDPSLAARAVPTDRWAMLAPGLKRVLKTPEAWPLTMAALRTAVMSKRLTNPAGSLL